MKKLLSIFAITLTATACTWVNENKAGQTISITTLNQVNNCQKIGNISTEVKHKIGFIKRGEKKILEELQVLARNEAIKLGAKTLVAESAPIEGKQQYQAFVCPK